jgi:hypothetical protein
VRATVGVTVGGRGVCVGVDVRTAVGVEVTVRVGVRVAVAVPVAVGVPVAVAVGAGVPHADAALPPVVRMVPLSPTTHATVVDAAAIPRRF